MKWKWRVPLILLTLAWWSLSPAAASKIKHFKDTQGTLHITNLESEDQAKPGTAPAAKVAPAPGLPAPGVPPPLPPVQPLQAPPPQPPPQMPRSAAAPPAEVPPEAPQKPEVQPDNEPPKENVEKPVSHLGGDTGSPLVCLRAGFSMQRQNEGSRDEIPAHQP
jgi:hypothetical protein